MFAAATKADVSRETDPQVAVIEILHHEHGIRRDKLVPTAAISDDLGVDGDDVSHLLARLHEVYGTNFEVLSDQWDAFFNHEGYSPRSCILTVLLFIPAIAIGVWVAVTFDLENHGAGIVTVVTFGALWLTAARLLPKGKPKRPVTIAGLGAIVSKGRWPSNPDEVF